MDWVPIVFASFKGLVFVTGLFYAVKWHYDKGRQGNQADRRAVMVAGGKVAAIFGISLVCLILATFDVIKLIGVDLNLP